MKRLYLFIAMLCCFSLAQAQKECDGGDHNPPKPNDPENYPAGDATSAGQLSYDPNEVIGPTGYDSVRWVSINDVLNYTILFENDPEFATAAAQIVDIRFDFANRTWMRGFGMGNYCFSNLSYPVANEPNAYQQRIDLKDSLGIYVDLIGGLDVVKRQAFWTFSTIDPETGYAPWQAEKGVLPVNDSTHVGEGFVTFSLKPYEGLRTGDTISIQANIVFDQNDTIPTNRWCNKIDAGLPQSRVLSTPHPSLPNVYNLTFQAQDDEGGSGVKEVLLYMANHSGIYEEIAACAVDSILQFPVEAGQQYQLYALAVDHTGNREPAKERPDVTLNFNQAPTDLALSDSLFQDDLPVGGFIGRLSTTDTDENSSFTYAMAEGEGATHNDMFQVEGDVLQIAQSFRNVEDSVFSVRLSTTDEGGLSFSKPFTLRMKHVLERPEPDTLTVSICEGDTYEFHGLVCDQAGFYRVTKANELMGDSILVLALSVLPRPEAPTVTCEGTHTLVSSVEQGNQWFLADGIPIEGATSQRFTPTEDGIYYVAVSNGACYSAPSQFCRVQMADQIDLQLGLAKGWNWISSNLSEDVYRSVAGYLSPIQEQVEWLRGRQSEWTKEEVVNSSDAIVPQESYKVKLNAGVVGEWAGATYQPSDVPISLENGWNWIGYVPVEENSLANALANLSPNEHDVIKSLDQFAIYSGGRWQGTLTTLKPGMGYMYYTTVAKQFTYPSVRLFPSVEISDDAALRADSAPWSYDAHKYPDNQTVIGELVVEGAPALAGVYTIGAFVGDECRGIGSYVDGKLFLTIHGSLNDAELVRFKAFENATTRELAISESFVMNGGQTGTMNAPFVFHISSATAVEDLSLTYNIYPNPVRGTLYIDGDVQQIQEVKILSTNGVMVLTTGIYTANGINVSGMLSGAYIVCIKTPQGYHYKKMIKY